MEMQAQIDTLIENIKADYTNYMLDGRDASELSVVQTQMIAEFNDGIAAKEGRKYIKITTAGSIWGFVVAGDDDKKFSKGAILKAAGYAAPARNHSRGNIVSGGYTIQWTGPLYM